MGDDGQHRAEHLVLRDVAVLSTSRNTVGSTYQPSLEVGRPPAPEGDPAAVALGLPDHAFDPRPVACRDDRAEDSAGSRGSPTVIARVASTAASTTSS